MADRVLVSGASGFIGAHVVAALLDAGYRVRGTVRNPGKAKHLTALPGAAERLELVKADLMDADPFSAHMDEVDYVLHTASPYELSVKDPQRDLVDPAVRGTLSMLKAAAASHTVRRVVVTSSVAAITDEPPARTISEADWNESSSLTRNPYYFSKVMAERAAWDFVTAHRPPWTLLTINPFMVIGPAHTKDLNVSNAVFAQMLNGGYPAIMRLAWGFVDVRDVAAAHVKILTAPGAEGRYLCAAETRTMQQVTELLRRSPQATPRLPKLKLDFPLGDTVVKLASKNRPAGQRSYLETHLGRIPRFDNSKIRRDLGIEFRDVDQSILDTVADLARWGHIKGRPA